MLFAIVWRQRLVGTITSDDGMNVRSSDGMPCIAVLYGLSMVGSFSSQEPAVLQWQCTVSGRLEINIWETRQWWHVKPLRNVKPSRKQSRTASTCALARIKRGPHGCCSLYCHNHKSPSKVEPLRPAYLILLTNILMHKQLRHPRKPTKVHCPNSPYMQKNEKLSYKYPAKLSVRN